jgi:aspartate-semialdehyde dehydrogenase
MLALASARSVGESLRFGGEELKVACATPAAFAGVDVVLMATGADVSAALAPAAVAAGAVVIDNSSHYRLDADVPLVVPEVNPEALALHRRKGIVANPNCATVQMVVALAPLHRSLTTTRVVACTYQAVSGRGKKGIDELSAQVMALYNHGDIETTAFAKRIAFNCLPHIDAFTADGSTKEEQKLLHETRKILGAAALPLCATCVRVPVFNGHAVAVHASFAKPFTLEAARALLRTAPGVVLRDDTETPEAYPTPIEVDGEDATFVGRLRLDPSAANSLSFWCVADNLRKGAATNAVQIAELLVRDHLGKGAAATA